MTNATSAKQNVKNFQDQKVSDSLTRASEIAEYVSLEIEKASKDGIKYLKLNPKSDSEYKLREIFTYSFMNSPCFLTEIGKHLKGLMESVEFSVKINENSWSFIIEW